MGLDLKILIEGDPKGFIEAIDEVNAKSEDLNNTLSGIGTKASIAFAAFSGAIVGSLVAYRESEQAVAQLDATIQSTGRASQVSSEDLQKFATKLQDVTTFGDEAIITAETILLKFRKIGPEALEPATKAAADLATRMGGDLAGAAQLLGKALEDPEKGLTLLQKQGVGFTEAQQKLIKSFNETGETAKAQAIIFQQVNAAFGGAATTAAGGLGVYVQLKEVLGDIVEGIGKQFAPTFISAGKVLVEFAKGIRDNEVLLNAIARVLAAGAGMAGFIAAITLGTLAVSKIVSTFEILQIALGATRIQFALMAGAATLGIGLILAFLPEIIAFAKDMVAAFVAAKDALIKTFTDLFKNIGNIILKYIELYASLFDWKKILTGDLSGIKNAGKALADAVGKTVDDAFGGIKEVKQAVSVKFESDAAKAAAEEAKKLADQKAANESAEKLRLEQEAADRKAAADRIADKKRNAQIEGEIAKERNEIVAIHDQKYLGDQQKLAEQEAQLRENVNTAKTADDRKFAETQLRDFEAAQVQKKAEVVKYKEEEIKLLKDLEEAKTADDRALAAAKLAEFQANEDAHIQAVIEKADEERLAKQNKQIQDREERKAIEAEYMALDAEDRAIATETDLATLDTEQLQRREVLRKYAEDEAKMKADQRAAQMKDQVKYGETYAAINAAINSNEIKGVSDATSQLAQLTQSKNSTLKGIGKAAAITQIGIDTAKAAMSIYSGFATIPIVGPALGVAGAAAAIAFGAEKANAIRSAATGGIVPGFGSGDTVPMMLEPGEIIVPKALAPNFQQAVGNLTPDGEAQPRTVQEFHINNPIGTNEFVKGSLIPAIRDAVQLDNANIGVG